MQIITENNLRLDNKTIILTGAAGFIGSNSARSLAMVGADLILIDIDRAKLNSLKKKYIILCHVI